VTTAIHPRDRVERFLNCTTLAEQTRLYEKEWDNVRWRMLFKAILNRWTLKRTYDPGFFSHVENESFSSHFHGVFERTVTRNLVAENYFLHHMLTGVYPRGRGTALPPYLDPTSSNQISERGVYGLELVDGAFQDYLWQCDDSSVDGIVLSNICEWMAAGEIKLLFASIARVARPGARVCFRNFVGHTEVPEDSASRIVEDRAAGARAIQHDRSCVQSRFASCVVRKEA
jgi:S-adenosylmethionine-diacylglycerol 3-amino-3-carboxypropyl transferase